MVESTFITETPTTKITINTIVTKTSSDILASYEKKDKFEKLCREGCPNYNNKWACPPYSPSYRSYCSNFTHALVIIFYGTLTQFGYIQRDYMKVKAANAILKPKLDKFLRSLEPIYNGKMLSNGSCRLCNPCNKKLNIDNCKRSQQRRYSMESLGLDVEQISLNLANHQLQWYHKKKAPLYTSVVGCLLSNQSIDECDVLVRLNSFFSFR